jgi:hypothetical protein
LRAAGLHADGMLKLNPAHTLLWRTTTSVQFGADEPVVELTGVGTAHERIIGVLQAGVSDVSLVAIAANVGFTAVQLHELLAALEPALLREDAPMPWRIFLDGSGLTTAWLRELLVAGGHEIVTGKPHVAIVVSHFVGQPELTGTWLRRDIAHLPIVFGDSQVRIGPLIVPGRGPCAHCVQLSHTDTDEAWPILASQLLGKPSLLELPRLSMEIATRVTRWIDNAAGPLGASGWMNRFHPLEGLHLGEMVVIEALSGRMTTETYQPHPRCACQALPQNVTPIGSPRGANPALTMTTTDVAGHG